MAKRPLAERFWEKVNKTDSCWLWLGSVRKADGYGQIGHNSRMRTTHRFSYETFVGPVPADMFVLHKCDVRRCVNPKHLFLGKQVDNISDMFKKGRAWTQLSPEKAVTNGHRNRHFLPVLSGEDSMAAKLTVSKVRQIKKLLIEGVSKTAIGKRFGITRTAVWHIATGKSWKGVE